MLTQPGEPGCVIALCLASAESGDQHLHVKYKIVFSILGYLFLKRLKSTKFITASLLLKCGVEFQKDNLP